MGNPVVGSQEDFVSEPQEGFGPSAGEQAWPTQPVPSVQGAVPDAGAPGEQPGAPAEQPGVLQAAQAAGPESVYPRVEAVPGALGMQAAPTAQQLGPEQAREQWYGGYGAPPPGWGGPYIGSVYGGPPPVAPPAKRRLSKIPVSVA